ncbi:hypothetical protein BDZ97DRAFT_1655807 [Flammula alnicola]|nr:hypothetical protein BDZ97DRAFT_1655807 [Flammula alnicola]
MEQYLTRSLTTPIKLEPFVISNKKPDSIVTICAWLPDAELPFLEKWIGNWHGSVSLLVTTAAMPGSSSHGKLLRTIRKLVSQATMSGLSIHIIHVGENQAGSPNLYLNLARLFALTDWTLLFPSDLSKPISPKIYESMVSMKWETKRGIHFLASGSDSYPFPTLSPLLLPTKQDFWCTERIFIGVSRVSDWNECLWQVSLETVGKIHIVDVPIKDVPVEENAGAEVGRRLSARFRAEMCDTFLKQMTVVHPRGRYREIALDWVKSFCSKVRLCFFGVVHSTTPSRQSLGN